MILVLIRNSFPYFFLKKTNMNRCVVYFEKKIFIKIFNKTLENFLEISLQFRSVTLRFENPNV